MELREINVRYSRQFREYEKLKGVLPGLDGALSFPGLLMRAIRSPDGYLTGCAWTELYCQADQPERDRLKHAFEEAECVHATIDVRPKELIVVEVQFCPNRKKGPAFFLTSTFRPSHPAPIMSRWIRAHGS